MKSFAVAALAAVTLFAAAPSRADVVSLDFETATDYTPIGTLYAGQGITFGDGLLGIYNNPSFTYFVSPGNGDGAFAPVGSLSPTSDYWINVATGFTALTFDYAAFAAVVGGVKVWSGLNGTGTLLATLDLAANNAANPYTTFNTLSSGDLSQVAYSITFADAVDNAGFDNLLISAVPEPASLALMGLGLAVAGAIRVRRQRA